MSVFQALTALFPLSLMAGVKLYATLLVTGLCIRFGWAHSIPPGLEPLGSDLGLTIVGVLYGIEFIADKVPFVDNIWDAIHTIVRPIGAAVVAGMVFLQVDPQWTVGVGIVAAGIALTSHGGKSSTRVALNVASPLENISNIVLSLIEDFVVAIVVYLALQVPWVALFVTVIMWIALLVAIPLMLRWLFFVIGSLRARIRAWSGKMRVATLPSELAPLLGGESIQAITEAIAQRVPNAHGRRGWLVLTEQSLLFVWKRGTQAQEWRVERTQVSAPKLRGGLLNDVLQMNYQAGPIQQTVRFASQKDMHGMVDIAAQLGAQLPQRGGTSVMSTNLPRV